MEEASRHDAWQAAASYDIYMGHWSRRIAPQFVAWLGAPPGLDWLDIGCGTGALTEAILAQASPAHVLSIDPSADFIAGARANAPMTARRSGSVTHRPSPWPTPAATRRCRDWS